MPPQDESSSMQGLGSLIDEVAAPAAASKSRARRRLTLNPGQQKLARRVGTLAALVLLLVGGLWGIVSMIPRAEPDYLSSDMEDILDYTLLSDDFNSLPIERRMELLRDLVARLKTMSGDDSAAMAAFAATIRREMRTQIERNMKQLAADTIDIYASDYAHVPPEEQQRFLDDAIIGFTEMMETVAGEESPLPRDEGERLAVLKDQAKRDEVRLRDSDSRPTAGRVARFFEFIHSDQENISSPVQRGRNVRFMRDMTRHLRGQDVATGKPRSGPG